MGSFNTRITTDEYAMADTMVIDEDGIDLLLDGDQVIAASFEGLDIFEVMRHILPEDRIKPEGVTQLQFEATVAQIIADAKDAKATDPKELAEGIEFLERSIIGNLVALSLVNEATK